MIAQLDYEYIQTRPSKTLPRLLSYALFEGRALTTRAQWFNPVVLTQFALIKRLPQLQRVEKPIFILGMGRSGSTILGKVLSMHSHIGLLNEPKALWYSVHSEEDLIGTYSRGPGRYRLDGVDATPEARRAAHRFYGYFSRLTRAKRIVDKHGEMIFRMPFIQAIFPDAKFLFLVRNGWDTARSIAEWSRREGEHVGQETHDWWGADRRKWRLLNEGVVAPDPVFAQTHQTIAGFTRHEDMAAVEWTVTMREGIHLMRTMGNRIHEVRYEDLASRPEPVLRDVLAFCELPEDPTFQAYAQRVLSPAPPKKPFPLHPAIEPVFLATMQELHYAIDG